MEILLCSSKRVPASRWRRTTSSERSIAASQGAESGSGAAANSSSGTALFPDGLVNGTVGRLVLRGEQGFDLLVGLVHRAHPAGLLLGLAAQAQGGFGEALLPVGVTLRRTHAILTK